MAGEAQGLQRAGAMEMVAAQPRADARSIVARAKAGAARRPVAVVGAAVGVAEGVHLGRNHGCWSPVPSPPQGLSPLRCRCLLRTPREWPIQAQVVRLEQPVL